MHMLSEGELPFFMNELPHMDTVTSILDHSAVSGRYLFPQDRKFAAPFMVPVQGAAIACYRRIVDQYRPTLVHFHGNGEAVADYVPEMADVFASLGVNSLFVEYRHYGDSTGKAGLVAMLGDGEAALAAAGIPAEKAIVFGRSIGSLYAIELAARHPEIAGLVIESGIADPAERFLVHADFSSVDFTEQEVRAEVRRWFDHRQKLSHYLNPLLVLHTENDGLIDISHAERNYEWAGSAIKKLVRFRSGNHNTIMRANHRAYFETLGDFINIVS